MRREYHAALLGKCFSKQICLLDESCADATRLAISKDADACHSPALLMDWAAAVIGGIHSAMSAS
jgi:hypothetical protein